MLRFFLGVIILSLVFANASALAAPTFCSQVLVTSKSISAEKLAKAIFELAQMKMESDLETAKGSVGSGGPQIPLKGLYQKKLQELIFKLRGQETLASLQFKIKTEIAKFQKTKSEEAARETTERKIEEEAIPVFKNLEYMIEQHTPVNWFQGRLLYHTSTDSALLSHKNGALELLNLQTEEIVGISKNAYAAKILPDQEHILSYSNEGFIQVHRIDNGKLTSNIQIPVDLSQMKYDIGEFSQDNSRLATASRDKIVILDAQNGSAIATVNKKDLADVVSDISRVEFIDNDNLLIRLPSDARFIHLLIRYNLSTKTHQTVEISDKAGLAFSGDRQTIFTAYSDTILLRSSDLSEISRTVTRGLSSKNGNLIRAIPNSHLQLIASMDRTSRPFAYFSDIASDITVPTFTFSENYYLQQGLSPWFPKEAVFADDGNTLLIMSEKVHPKTGVSTFNIDKWKLK